MEVPKLRMDRTKMMIDDNRKDLANMKDRVAAIEKVGGGSANTMALKADFNLLKKEVVPIGP